MSRATAPLLPGRAQQVLGRAQQVPGRAQQVLCLRWSPLLEVAVASPVSRERCASTGRMPAYALARGGVCWLSATACHSVAGPAGAQPAPETRRDGQDGTGQDGTGRDGTGRDGTGRDGTHATSAPPGGDALVSDQGPVTGRSGTQRMPSFEVQAGQAPQPCWAWTFLAMSICWARLA